MTNSGQIFITITTKNQQIYNNHILPRYELHIAGHIRNKYELDETLFALDGNVLVVNQQAVRSLVYKINAKRSYGEHVYTGEVSAVGLLDEIYHFILREYEINENPGVFNRAVSTVFSGLGSSKANEILEDFVRIFPPLSVYKGDISIEDYLNGTSGDRSNKEVVLEEMIMLHIVNFNPASKKLKELFAEHYLSDKDNYSKLVSILEAFFQKEKPYGPDNQDIFSLFKSPILSSPDDLFNQLEFILNHWKSILNEDFLKRILLGKDLMKEDYALMGFGGGNAPSVVPVYKGVIDADLTIGKSFYNYGKDANLLYEEPEAFTEDVEWMPNVKLIAKNAFVWLDQLSKKYEMHIHRLDQIPDEELDDLARWNFNSLWLIGIWERSSASKRIKHIMGNIDAVASAYSLWDYVIAHDLGGEEAYRNLNERAKARGIRLASDMVPNHTGIFSKWMIEKPHYFVQRDNPPFPGYTFNGENLSQDHNIQLRIEDGYFSKTDASVVFQRIDNRTGEVKYVYHGNDGTSMPWNDTAQLDLLKAEVREAVIQEIFSVARRFSVIRFDAAMTLTKKHFQRLWYPQPGMGGDIPSRTEYSLTRQQFDELFPKEFWREVVDRINNEMPETLLLAEAFWLMEGYFVRTLGMHRVYNSAFMHMMMKEENEKYRDLITNTLEFEPEILKRYVNFMSNPDEETAIHQFGTGDKYFGVLTMMITLPGLPMFAHGQIEGFTEKYGMEYKRAYYNETPDRNLIQKHEREIFPVMSRRYLFSNVYNFWLFDFIEDHGGINENVFAFVNGHHHERVLVLYNNKYDRAAGRIYRSTPKLVSKNGNKVPETVTLPESLIVKNNYNIFYIFREHITGLEYIKTGSDIYNNGFYFVLDGFTYRVFWEFREVYDDSGEMHRLMDMLAGRGVPNVQNAIKEMRMQPIHKELQSIFEDKSISGFINKYILNGETEENKDIEKVDDRFIINNCERFFKESKSFFNSTDSVKEHVEELKSNCRSITELNRILKKELDLLHSPRFKKLNQCYRLSERTNYRENSYIILLVKILDSFKTLISASDYGKKEDFFDDLLLSVPANNILKRLGRGENEINNEILLIKALLKNPKSLIKVPDEDLAKISRKSDKEFKEYLFNYKYEILEELLEDKTISSFLGINIYNDVTYYSKERFEEFADWVLTLTLIETVKEMENETDSRIFESIAISFFIHQQLIKKSENSGYKVNELLRTAKEK